MFQIFYKHCMQALFNVSAASFFFINVNKKFNERLLFTKIHHNSFSLSPISSTTANDLTLTKQFTYTQESRYRKLLLSIL